MSDAAAIVRWYLALTAVTAGCLPIVAWLGARLGGARFGLARPLSLVILTAVVWWPAAAVGVPFARLTLIVALLALGVFGWALWWRARFDGLELRALVAFEAAWLGTFLVYAWFRGFNPDIAHTEKPMEIALLSSITRSNAVPAPDPWYAGSTINYYYFGYQTIASAVKLSGVPPIIAFNLALATLFASCATAAASTGVALARRVSASLAARWLAGALSAVFLLLAGNLETARRLAQNASATIAAGWWDGVGWQASRIIVDHNLPDHPPGPRETINEFPAFSFVLGDLHPHVLTYPLLAAVVALAIGVLTSDERLDYPRLAAIGALIGLLYASNSWDAPLGFVLLAGAVGLSLRFRWRTCLPALGAVAGGALLAAAPFILTFHPPVGVANPDVPRWLNDMPLLGAVARTFGIVNWRPTVLRELLIVHGAWLAIFALFAAFVVLADRTYVAVLRSRGDRVLICGLVSLAAAIVWAPALVVIGWPLALAIWIALRERDAATRAISGLFAVAFMLVLVPEFVFIQDVFGDRMNTVFKLYFQAWLLFSLASAAALVLLLQRVRRSTRPALVVAMLAILIVTLPYVRLSAWDWSGQFKQRQSLNGAAFVARVSPGDAAAIDWVRSNAQPGDVLVEAPGCSYGEYYGVPMDRVSAYTGIPALLGWQGHEEQWRRGQYADIGAVLSVRTELEASYLDGAQPDASNGQPTILILGRFETEALPGCGLTVVRADGIVATLENAGWRQAFESDGTRVFVRAGRAGAGALDVRRARLIGVTVR